MEIMVFLVVFFIAFTTVRAQVIWQNNYCSTNRNPCLNGGACIDRSRRPGIVSWYICQCHSGYSGDHCENTQSAVSDPNWQNRYCSSNPNPCLNGGQCIDRSRRPSLVSWYICHCPGRYSGDHCENSQTPVSDTIWQNRYCSAKPNPCLNGGRCIDRSRQPSLVSWYRCRCPGGYSGDHCENRPAPVSDTTWQNRYCSAKPNPCLNGGECIDRSRRPSLVSWYICGCPAGFSGDHCENRQTPVSDPSWQNRYCQANPNPCLNGGECVDRSRRPSIVSWYICRCRGGYKGDHCETRPSADPAWRNRYCHVERNPCLNGGRCIDRSIKPSIRSWYVCHCLNGFTGDHCEKVVVSDDTWQNRYCSVIRNPCLNGGECIDRTVDPSIVSWYICRCPPGRKGDHCEESVSSDPTRQGRYCQVKPNPCLNGGACIDRTSDPTMVSWYICRCPSGSGGDHCEHSVDSVPDSDDEQNYYCSRNRNPCLNGGNCVDRSQNPTIVSWYICACPTGYSGDHCEHSSGGAAFAVGGYCSRIQNPCLNGGYCVDGAVGGAATVAFYRCQCPLTCKGTHCEDCLGYGSRQVLSCHEKPCMNGGTCVDLNATQICYCNPGCEGYYCETCRESAAAVLPTSPCSPNPCVGDCLCRPSCRHSGGYYCMSESGFLGKNCTIRPPNLSCEPGMMVISVSSEFLEEYDQGLGNSRIYFSSDSKNVENDCLATEIEGEYRFEIPLPFTACGTTVLSSSSGSETGFTNIMWINRVLSNPDFDVALPAVRFRCTYEREYDIVTSIRPVVAEISDISQTLNIPPEISLCKSPVCPRVCPSHLEVTNGAVYTVGETLHVTMTLGDQPLFEGRDDVKTLHSMSLSCDGKAAASPVQLLASGCAMASGIPFKVSHSGKSSTVCVSFDVPRLPCEEFYIHAKMQSCASSLLTICPDSVNSVCGASGQGRKKRSASASGSVVIGPIYIIVNATAGEGEVHMFPEELSSPSSSNEFDHANDNEKEPVADRLWTYILGATLAAVAVALIALAAVVKVGRNTSLERL